MQAACRPTTRKLVVEFFYFQEEGGKKGIFHNPGEQFRGENGADSNCIFSLGLPLVSLFMNQRTETMLPSKNAVPFVVTVVLFCPEAG